MVPSTPGYEDRRDFFIAIRLVGICHAGSLALGNPQCLGGGSECMVGLAGNCSTVPPCSTTAGAGFAPLRASSHSAGCAAKNCAIAAAMGLGPSTTDPCEPPCSVLYSQWGSTSVSALAPV